MTPEELEEWRMAIAIIPDHPDHPTRTAEPPPRHPAMSTKTTPTAPLCECGQSSCGRFMHVQVVGLFESLCEDCLEDANTIDTIYAKPCPDCRGNGAIMGEPCESCDGDGRDDW